MNIVEELTQRQEEILAYIATHMREQGTWPSFREIQSHFGFKSTNAVMGHLKALEKKGYLTRVAGQARTFKLNHQLMEENLPADALDLVDVPLYGSIAAGYPDGVESSGEIGRLQVDRQTAGLGRGKRSFALKVRGESMIDAGIQDGDIVIVEQRPAEDNDIVAALIDGETTLKRFVHKPGRAPYLKAENQIYPQLHPVSELLIQGVAKAIVRNL